MNTPYALILTDSTHAPTVIGHYNSRQTIDEIRSAIRHDTKRTRIPNAYDSGYHFENIPVKERRLKIDF